MDTVTFRKLWTEYTPPETPAHLLPGSPKPPPVDILVFQSWAQDLLASLGERPTVVTINQAKLLLLDRYMDMRQFVSKRERDRTGTASRSSITSIFSDTYTALRRAELAQKGTLLFLPAEPVQTARALPAQVYLGTLVEDDADDDQP